MSSTPRSPSRTASARRPGTRALRPKYVLGRCVLGKVAEPGLIGKASGVRVGARPGRNPRGARASRPARDPTRPGRRRTARARSAGATAAARRPVPRRGHSWRLWATRAAGSTSAGHGSEHPPRPGRVPLGEVGPHHNGDHQQVAGCQRASALSGGNRLRVPTAAEQWPREALRNID